MPRFICESCGTGLYSAARPGNLIDPSCPFCRASLQAQREVERWDDDGGGLRLIVPATAATPMEVS